jgi:hypothetical protein
MLTRSPEALLRIEAARGLDLDQITDLKLAGGGCVARELSWIFARCIPNNAVAALNAWPYKNDYSIMLGACSASFF